MMGRAFVVVIGALAIAGQLAGSAVISTWQHSTTASAVLVPKLLLWNASASAPRGLYLLRRAAPLEAGELVAVTPPQQLARWLASRSYLPVGVPLLKHIAALPGQTVCRKGNTVTIDGAVVARTLRQDHLDRLLPIWDGCRRLRAGEVFLLNSVADSMDGRYFGPLPLAAVAAQAIPLWTEPTP
jgi:conjugative transfer signal peptidase TraF